MGNSSATRTSNNYLCDCTDRDTEEADLKYDKDKILELRTSSRYPESSTKKSALSTERTTFSSSAKIEQEGQDSQEGKILRVKDISIQEEANSVDAYSEIRENKYKSGDVYHGELKNDKRQGYGVLEILNSGKYTGNFKNDYYDGYGVFFWKDGKIYQGNWKRGVFEGEGKMIYPNGDIYRGNYSKGLRDGKGSFFVFKTNLEYVGNWSQGLQHGRGVIKSENNGPASVIFNNGLFIKFSDQK